MGQQKPNVTVVDGNGRFLFMNGTGAERLGRRPEDVVGKTMWDMFPKEEADRQADIVRQVVNTGQAVAAEMPTAAS